jgi:hypothetical protein
MDRILSLPQWILEEAYCILYDRISKRKGELVSLKFGLTGNYYFCFHK